MRSLTLMLFLSLMLIIPVSCSKKKEITGKEFIPRDVLVDVLVDVHLVDGITNDRKFFHRFEDVDSIDVLGPILEKYQVDRQMFDTTLYIYSRHPDLLDQVYNDVLMKLNIMLYDNDEEKKVSKPEELSEPPQNPPGSQRRSLPDSVVSESVLRSRPDLRPKKQ